MIGNKIANKITEVSKSSPQNNLETIRNEQLQYCKHQPALDNNNAITNFDANNTTTECLKLKK